MLTAAGIIANTNQGSIAMEIMEVGDLIRNSIEDAEVIVEGEGCSFSVVVVSILFEGYSLLKKQQMVLAAVKEPLATGELHAITVKAYTPDEWARLS
ncbi:MAG: BolA/IbaG family iron-sulfur metabolism protein [Methylococcales bacterium]|nr:BolA/IbaG family iron-sulfur metabolism protein [Methylococcales bacterium]